VARAAGLKLPVAAGSADLDGALASIDENGEQPLARGPAPDDVDKVAIVHPITGELLGELDEEVASGRVVEVRDKFSVVEVEKAAAGVQVQVKDRVVLR